MRPQLSIFQSADPVAAERGSFVALPLKAQLDPRQGPIEVRSILTPEEAAEFETLCDRIAVVLSRRAAERDAAWDAEYGQGHE